MGDLPFRNSELSGGGGTFMGRTASQTHLRGEDTVGDEFWCCNDVIEEKTGGGDKTGDTLDRKSWWIE